jgi:hypothetical protein
MIVSSKNENCITIGIGGKQQWAKIDPKPAWALGIQNLFFDLVRGDILLRQLKLGSNFPLGIQN